MISRPALIIPQLGNKQNQLGINSQQIKRPALAIKSITGQTQFLVPVANSSMKNKLLVVPKKSVINYLKPMVKLPPTSSTDSRGLSQQMGQPLKSSTNAQTPHSTSILILPNSKSPKVPQTKSFSTGRTAPKITDKQTKDHFMMSLGLVTKETLTELQSRKCERKRRTTANPQFSSAALEAKRITKLELAERKAKRRLLISNTSETTAAPNPEPTKQTSKTTYLSSGSSPKSIGVEPQEISPGVYIVTSIGKFLTPNCFVCDELCEYECDSILFCKPCKTLFHATCVITKADIIERAALPKCPKCDSVRKKSEEKLAKKREERDSLLAKKKEFEDQLAQMRRALNSLKIKLKEKGEEKVSLVANHEKVQQKVDKIIDTLKLVEDTSEWEDGFAAALEAATAPTKSETTPLTSGSPPPTADDRDEQMEADSIEQTDAELEAMNVETCRAAEALEQLNKAESQSIDMAEQEDEEEHQMYELECHENGADMYDEDIFVEEVHESVDMVSESDSTAGMTAGST